MTSNPAMRRVDRASRIIRAAPEAIYSALIDPEALVTWLPPKGMSGRIEAFEPRVDGTFRMILTYNHLDHSAPGKHSEHSDLAEGRFVELVQNERVVQVVEFPSDDPLFAGEMRMTWAVARVDGGAEVSFIAENVPEGINQEDHELGLKSSLENLAEFCE